MSGGSVRKKDTKPDIADKKQLEISGNGLFLNLLSDF